MSDWRKAKPPAEADVYPDFSDTVTDALAETGRHLALIEPHRHRSVEYQNLERQMLQNLLEEAKELRAALAAALTTINTKSSKASLARFQTELTAKVDKRLDTLRNITLAVATLGLSILGLIGVFKH